MVEVPALRCQYCGGALSLGVPQCPYCRSAVASVRCATCFHANTPDAARCAGCGRELGLEPIPSADSLACPSCQVSFVAIDAGSGGAVHDCPRCGGQFVDHETLRGIFVSHPRAGATTGPQRVDVGLDAPVRYRPCPVCRNLMNRKNFGEVSGIIVDVCKPHGVWFDPGELPRVLAFVETGGLEEAARRQELQRRAEVRKLAEIEAESARSFGMGFDDSASSVLDIGRRTSVDLVIGMLFEGARHLR